MPTPVVSAATTTWNGQLLTGRGSVSLDSSRAVTLNMSWKARAEGGAETTTPEELLAAAHSGCFSMAFANILAQAEFTPDHIVTTSEVTFRASVGVVSSHLTVRARVPGISRSEFEALATQAKETCPVSQALAGIDISLEAVLE
ncbi:MAG TPA: OsmC family peroxiredoxin [Microbacteriaceae bacterium]|nr:OsmC family peroxiredoxin [Microbacteriaceae bacterium]